MDLPKAILLQIVIILQMNFLNHIRHSILLVLNF